MLRKRVDFEIRRVAADPLFYRSPGELRPLSSRLAGLNFNSEKYDYPFEEEAMLSEQKSALFRVNSRIGCFGVSLKVLI